MHRLARLCNYRVHERSASLSSDSSANNAATIDTWRQWGAADAPLLIYVHGWGDCGSTFQFVVDSLQKEWRVVAPDWRGFGRSTVDCSSYWFPDYLADLHELGEQLSPS